MKNCPDRSGRAWQVALAALVGIFLVAMAASLVVAKRKVSRVVDANYYSHGLQYGTEQERGGRGRLEGWRLNSSLVEGQIQVRVADRTDAPVTGGRMIFEPAWADRGTGSALIELGELRPGVYRTAAAKGFRGETRGILTFSRGGAELREKVVVFN